MADPIPVVCDRCRETGLSGEAVFARFGALLDFDPVPRRTARADGWDEEVQRTFIAALSLTGSVRAACRAVGKAAFGVAQLLAAPGNEGFAAAYDEAMALAADERSRRLAEGIAAVASDHEGWRPPASPWADARRRGRPPAHEARQKRVASSKLEDLDPAAAEAARAEFEKTVLAKYVTKLRFERRARLAGRIVEADFYVRQLTWIEMLLDLGTDDAWRVLADLRRGGHGAIDIAESPVSRILDAARRRAWAEAGEPSRPDHPPAGSAHDQGLFSTEPIDVERGVADREERLRLEAERRARQEEAARAQIEWEETAREEAAAWRERLEADEARYGPSPLEGEGGTRPRSGWEGEGTSSAGAPEVDGQPAAAPAAPDENPAP